MRILHILEATAGGTRRHVLDLLPALARRGLDCTLIYSPLRYPPFERDAALLREQNITTIPVPMTRSWDAAVDLPAIQTIRSVIAKSTFDIIHAHSSKAGFVGRLAAGIRHRSTVIYTPHCIAPHAALPLRQRRLARLAETLLAPLTARYIAVSMPEKRFLQHSGIARRRPVHLIYNGIDANGAAEPMPHSPVFHLGCIGRLSQQKNQEFTLYLLRELLRASSHPPQLHLVGDGENRTALQQLARRWGVHDSVVWHGDVADPTSLYAQCDVMLQPSRWEGCPYSVLEAMAAARPVLASSAGAMPELLHGCGETFKLHHPHHWLHTLKNWQENHSEREALGKRARERVQRYFCLDAMVEKTLRVYQENGMPRNQRFVP